MVPRTEDEKSPRECKGACDLTLDTIRLIMHLAYMHGQRHEFLPRQQEVNPMNWVSQRPTRDYTAVLVTPKQGVRDSPQHSGAETYAHPERCGQGAASVGVAGLACGRIWTSRIS